MGKGRHYDKFSYFILQVKRRGEWVDVSTANSLESILIQEDKMHEASFVTTRILSEWESGKRYFVYRDYVIPREDATV